MSAHGPTGVERRSPRVSVVIAVHNGEAHLRAAVASVLRQTMPEFELIVADDCSDDSTPSILASFTDPRLHVIRTDTRSGAGAARNLAIGQARGAYIALQDADDIAFPNRLELQTRMLDGRKEKLVVVSTPMVVIDERDRGRGYVEKPSGSLALRWFLIFYPPLAHAAAMFVRDALGSEAPYENRLTPAEDYGLFVRLLARGEGDNLTRPLLFYRRHAGQMSRTLRDRQLLRHDEVALRALAQELPDARLDRELFSAVWRHVAGLRPEGDAVELGHVYLDLFEAFAARHVGDPQLPEVRRQALSEIARRSLVGGSARGRARLLGRILDLDPLAVVSAPASLGRMAAHRARWRLARPPQS